MDRRTFCGGAVTLSLLGGAPRAEGQGKEPRPVRARMKAGEWKERPARVLADLDGFRAPAAAAALTPYGGWRERKVGAGAGFFRTLKRGDRWWMVDPDGCLYLNIAVNSVRPELSPGMRPGFEKAFGTEARWAEKTAALLRGLGFHGAGSWSNAEHLEKATPRLPYCRMWNFMSGYGRRRGGTFRQPGHTGYPGDAIFAFDPGFEAFAQEHAKQIAALKGDPFLVGHFSDNELPFPKDALDKFLRLAESDHGGRAAREWTRARKGSVTAELTDADREAWRGHVADRYFGIVARAIRKNDPNHLLLGSRFYGAEKNSEAVLRAAGRHLDVVSCNVYGSWNPRAAVERWALWAGKPVLVTEWYAKGDDAGFGNTAGAGWTVPTQADRGRFYQHFTLELLESQACVGWHWFKYLDNDPLDKAADPSNSDSNKGILNARYEPYAPLADAMRELNRAAYPLAEHFDGR